MKGMTLTLATCLLLAPLAREARADGDRATPQEERDYASREADAPALAGFRGGCMSEEMMWFMVATAPIWIALLPVGLLAYGCARLCEELFTPPPGKHLPPPEKEQSRRPSPVPRHS
jgi:hypothetical protein